MANSRQEEMEGTYQHETREKCLLDFGLMTGRHEGPVDKHTWIQAVV